MAKLDLSALKKGTPTPEAAKPAATPTPSPAPAAKPAAGLAFLKNRTAAPSVGTGGGNPIPGPNDPKPSTGLGFLQKQAAAPKPAPAPAPTPSVADLPVDDLDLETLLNDDSGGSKPVERVKSRFADEVPAEPPERQLPEDMDKSMTQFVASIDTVYQVVHEPDLLGGIIKNIMMELSQKPEYRKLIQPKDIHTMIKGMRDSMGMARIKKEEAKAKRSGGKKKTSTKIDDLDVLAALDELGDFS